MTQTSNPGPKAPAGGNHGSGKLIVFGLVITIVAAGLLFFFRSSVAAFFLRVFEILGDREQIRAFIDQFGNGAPFVFIGIQILQVIFAPVPGEATGFIGGFLFGTLPGFVYSSVGLTIGSWLNFLIGRFLGERYVRRVIPDRHLTRLDKFVRRQGVFVLTVLFIFPGFPKDYLCLFLGISTIPMKMFMLMTAFGRMPGTLMLSLQGASLYERNYLLLGITAAACLVALGIMYLYRERIYIWIDNNNRKRTLR
jgi:uncharacterized membrane protein YdjX (TVP38/TMEM64 family)